MVRRFLLLAVACGCVLPFVLAWIPLDVSISRFIIEDMFYYMQGARSLVDGKGPTLDGYNATNGFHPLWMALCCFVERASGGDRVLGAHLALTLCAAFFVASGGLLYRALAASPAAPLALPVTALWMASYRLMAIALGGLEASLSACALAAVLVFLVRRPALDAPRDAVRLGVLLGLAALARMDNLLLIAVVLGFITLRPVVDSKDVELKPGRLRSVLTAGFLAAALLVPWCAFSVATSGTPLPNSSRALAVHKQPLWQPERPLSDNLRTWAKLRIHALVDLAKDLANALGTWPIAGPTGGRLVLAGALVGAAAAAVALRMLFLGWRAGVLREHGWIAIYAVLHTAYYVKVGQISIRYVMPLLPPLFFLLALCAMEWVRREPAKRTGTAHAVLAAMVLCAAVAGADAWRHSFATDRKHGLHHGLYVVLVPWLRAHTPPDARIGSFNAGILSHFSGRPVTNLDGVMNDRAIENLHARTLLAYIRAQGIRYLVDMEQQLDVYLGTFGGETDWRRGWREIHRVPCRYAGGRSVSDAVVLEQVSPGS